MAERLINLPQVFPEFVDKYLGYPTIFTLVVLFQGCFGGMGIIQTPKALSDAVNSPISRFIFLCAIAYTASSDIETAIFATVIFLVLLHVLRTKKEKEQIKKVYF